MSSLYRHEEQAKLFIGRMPSWAGSYGYPVRLTPQMHRLEAGTRCRLAPSSTGPLPTVILDEEGPFWVTEIIRSEGLDPDPRVAIRPI